MSQSIDQRQQQLRNAFEYHQQQIKLATERILEERGVDLERQVEMRELGPADAQIDPQFRQEAAEEMARELAQRGVRSGNFNLNDYRDVPDLGINRAEMARNIREEELGLEHGADRETSAQGIDHDPERREARTYADLKREHADAISSDLSGQSSEQEHDPIEFAEDREQESRPDRKYAELERAHAAAISPDGAELSAEPERLEFAEDMEHEHHTVQTRADPEPEHDAGLFAQSGNREEKPEVERIKSLEEKALGLLIDPSQQFGLDIDQLEEFGAENKELEEKLRFFEDHHPTQEHDMEH